MLRNGFSGGCRWMRVGALTVLMSGALILTSGSVMKIHAAGEDSAAAKPVDGVAGAGEVGTGRKQYADQVRQGYNFRFGKDKPFLPSNAQIEGNTFLQPGAFPTAAYCGHCHEEAYHEWRQSLHSNSFRAPFYRKNVDILINTKGIEYSRHCEGCHNPIALFSGGVTQNSHVDRKFDADGITCSVCHSIQKLQPTYGLGGYVMGVPAVMVDEAGKPIPGQVSYAEILAHPDRHSKAVMKDFYKTPEYCGACHKANLPKTVTDYKWLRAIGLYDEWQATSIAKQSPLPFYVKDYQGCQSCHMKREMVTAADYGAKDTAGADGKVVKTLASHRWLGGNTAVPFYYGFDEQLTKTAEFLKNQTLNVDLFAFRKVKDGGAGSSPGSATLVQDGLIAPLGSTSFELKPKDVVQAFVVIQNKGVGHSLIPEQRDFYEAWVEFVVKDASGREISHSGFLKPDGMLDERAHSFTNRLVDKDGQLLDKHEVWARRVVAYDATIPHGRSTLVRYQFQIPADAQGALSVTARVNYRHFRQNYLDFSIGKDHPAYPVVEMASRTRTVAIGANAAGMPDAGNASDNKEWMRWNNFGIALLDQQQYADAVDAFEHVVKMRPDYADGYTNIGLANISWEKYDSARESLNRSLALSANNARALYYMALVERNQGHMDAAIADLQKVTQQFPRSRDAHRELGFSYYQQHKYPQAREEYELLQGIDPDDLAAHYNLAIVYRRLGLKEQAAEQAAFFADKKDDPGAMTASLEFLRAHPEISNESVPWHLHTDGPMKEPAGVPVVPIGNGQGGLE